MRKLALLQVLCMLLCSAAIAQNTVGYGSGAGLLGNENTNVGYNAARLSIGTANANYGAGAGYSLTSGSYNSNFGGYSGVYMTTAVKNSNFGYSAGKAITTGTENSNFGNAAATSLTIGSFNSNFGSQSAYSMTIGSENSNFGFKAGYSISTGNFNSNFGSNAGYGITTGSYNTNFGYYSGYRTTTGVSNVNIGSLTGYSTTTGQYNTFIGNNAGYANITGNGNSALGNGAGAFNTTGGNTYIGYRAGAEYQPLRAYNVYLGYNAGSNFSSFNLDTKHNARSVFVLNNQAQLFSPLLFGYFADNPDHDNATSRTSLMAQLAINTHHVMDSCALTVSGAVHIGVQNKNPTDINIKNTYFKDYLLWVEKGIVASDLVISPVTGWGDFVFEKSYHLRPLNEVEAFILENKHLPEMPSAEQITEEGLSAKEMLKLQMVKIEELTLYTIEQQKEIDALRSSLLEIKQELQKLSKQTSQQR